jgi:hypothetical protein
VKSCKAGAEAFNAKRKNPRFIQGAVVIFIYMAGAAAASTQQHRFYIARPLLKDRGGAHLNSERSTIYRFSKTSDNLSMMKFWQHIAIAFGF